MERLIRADQAQRLDLALREQQPIERIGNTRVTVRNTRRVPHEHRERAEARSLDERLQRLCAKSRGKRRNGA